MPELNGVMSKGSRVEYGDRPLTRAGVTELDSPATAKVR